VAKGLNIVDNSVNPASFEFSSNIPQPPIYRVRIGVVRVLLRQSISWLGHSELALNLIEYHPGLLTLQVVIKVSPVDGRHTDIG
jgi:hypothetical protein